MHRAGTFVLPGCRIPAVPFVEASGTTARPPGLQEGDVAEYLLSVHHDYDEQFPPIEEMQPGDRRG